MRMKWSAPRPYKEGRQYFESIYKNCTMVYSEDLAVGDQIREGGFIDRVKVFKATGVVQFSFKGASSNFEVSVGCMVHLKKD